MAYVKPLSEPIAIIGSGCRYPGKVNTPSKLWTLLKEPYDLTRKAPNSRYNVDGFHHENGEYHGTTNAPNAYWIDESQDPRHFDAAFFRITPKECEAIDPQGKVLLEVVYEAMESGGLTMQDCAGQRIGVFVGTMTDDYVNLTVKDEVSYSQYGATGTSRAIISNRVSYFFHWNGPSMTIDTACSSSLVAMHSAVQSLRSGESTAACVAGANIMLAPEGFIMESSLHMLSPDGKSKMWDQSANGYARGEGVGVFFLKTLSRALADSDQIECIIRETGVNSDGRTKGITMPSPQAQAALIQDTYARSGLDPRNPADRCQYFEAHGTGTQAGDPREAEAIHTAFFGEVSTTESQPTEDDGRLLVGSIKTVIGHTEGAAGVAGVLKAVLGLKNRLIPPNQHLKTVNPSVEPFTRRLHVPTELTLWPQPFPGQPMRASVNSFGFGGTNAHAILERYEPDLHGSTVVEAQKGLETRDATADPLPALPFLLSASTDKTLSKKVGSLLEYIVANPTVNLQDVAWTLAFGRSDLPYKIAFPALEREALMQIMASRINANATQNGEIGVYSKGNDAGNGRPVNKILGIFTGQGAQWATMGHDLIVWSPLFKKSILDLDRELQKCPDPPTWSLIDELVAREGRSRLDQAFISQPLCTAIQVALVDLLKASGVQLSAVVGHSSGEIGAAYASGSITAREAILLAYYRGFHAKLAGGAADDCGERAKGAMMAVGMGVEDALDFCLKEGLESSVFVAASNAPSGVTLSGDLTAIQHAKQRLDESKKFARLLKVDTAYHSHHMDPAAAPYMKSLAACGIQARLPREDCPWVSSVYGPAGAPTAQELAARYWRDNMVQPVLFSEALKRVLEEHGPFDMALEIGPHPALKGPATQTMQETIGKTLPYSGVLNRSSGDMTAFSEALGLLWCTLGAKAVNLGGYAAAIGMPQPHPQTMARDLPPYPWDHSLVHYLEPRTMRQYLHRSAPPHELLGVRSSDDTESALRWRNILQPGMLPWLNDHRFQGQIIVPAAAYCVMGLDAARVMAAGLGVPASDISVIEIQNLEIQNGITMADDSQGVETVFSLQLVSADDDGSIVGHFALDWSPVKSSNSSAARAKKAVRGTVVVSRGSPSKGALPRRSSTASSDGLAKVDEDEFYQAVQEIGLGYTGPFRALRSLRRRLNFATAQLEKPHPEDNSTLLVSPALLDSSFQAAFAAFAAPGDGALWTSFLPQKIHRLRFNPALCLNHGNFSEGSLVQVDAAITQFQPTTINAQADFSADIDIYNPGNGCIEIQIEGLTVASFSIASAQDDRELYLQTVYKPDPWSNFTGPPVPALDGTVPIDLRLADLCAYLTNLYGQDNGLSNLDPQAMARCNALVSASPYRPYLELLLAVGKSVPALVPGLCQEILKDSLEVSLLHRHLTHLVDQISHRFPALRVLEIDRGNAAAGPFTPSIWDGLAVVVSSYTYAHDESCRVPNLAPGAGQAQFHKLRAIQLTHGKSLADHDIAGLQSGPFELVILSELESETTMREIRQLMRPGGFLITIRPHGSLLRERLFKSLSPAKVITSEDTALSADSTFIPSLREYGFGEFLHQYTTPQSGMSIAIAQAVSPEIELLRSPLSILSLPTAEKNESQLKGMINSTVAIIGGKRPEMAAIREKLQSVLLTLGCSVLCNPSFEEASAADFEGVHAAIVLADVDEPILQTMTASKLAALKALLLPKRYILWLTNGIRADQPYHTATAGMIRTIKGETPKLQLQFLDVDQLVGIEDTVAETFLRLAFTYEKDSAEDALWTIESELVLEHGHLLIPRLLPVHDSNDRLNSTRRVIEKDISVSKEVVELHPIRERGELVYSVSSLSQPKDQRSDGVEKTVVVRMLYTSAWAIDFGEGISLYIGLGVSPEGRRVITTAPYTASWASLPTSWVHQVNPNVESTSGASLVALLIQALMAQRLVGIRPPGPLATLEADSTFPSLLDEVLQDAQNKESWSLYHATVDHEKAATDSRFVFVHPRSTQREIADAVPISSGMLVDFTPRQASSSVLAKLARDGNFLVVYPGNTVAHLTSQLDNLGQLSAVQNTFVVDAVFNAQRHVAKALASRTMNVSIVAKLVAEMVGQGELSHFGVVDWVADAGKPVVQRIRPLEPASVLSPDKTYLLVGLTGDLGQSLAKLMVENGARYIVVASRNPGVANNWASRIESIGATVHLAPLDVTDLGALQRLKKELEASFPPVGGVINGAMILADGLFSEVSLEKFQRVLQPKIAGSKNLDVVFSQSDLDFFIMMSSLTAVVGNPGQSNYTAANMYMAGLAAQRRKRGLVASVLDIGMVVGIGYINRVEGAEIYANLRRQGYRPISERDIHHMFVEAIVAGRADVSSNNFNISQLTTGLQRVNRGQGTELAWHSDPRMSHHTADTMDGSNAEASSANASEALKDILRNCDSEKGIAENIQTAFASQLEAMLRLPAGSVSKDVPIIDLGVDSLVAVEVRTWFLREVERDMPVLKILGGDSIAVICDQVAKGIFEDRHSSAADDQAGAEGPRSFPVDGEGLFSMTGATVLPTADDDTSAYDHDQLALMSYPQARMWFPFLLLDDKSTYNCTTSYILRGPLDVPRFEAALHSVIQNHQVLRTSFFTDTVTGQPMQAVESTSPFSLKKVSVDSDYESAIATETNLVAHHVYDLENTDVFIATLLRHSSDHHTLIYGYHHIIIDGVSWQLFLQDVEHFYVKPVARPALPSVDYVDFAVKQRAEQHLAVTQSKRAFWKEIFSSLPSTIPLFPFANFKTRKPLKRYGNVEHQIEIPQSIVQRIKTVSSEHQSTSFHFYVAALQVLLHRFLKVDEMCIGITDANRTDPAFMTTIGLLLDSLPLWFRGLHGKESFSDRLQSTRNTIYSALGNSGIPLETILEDIGVESSASHMPLYQVMVNYRMNALGQETLGDDVKLEYLAYEDAKHPFDFNLNIDEKGGRGWVTLSMQDYLYDEAATSVFVKTYIHLLNAFSTTPLSSVDTPEMYSEAQHVEALELGVGSQPSPRAEHIGTTLPAFVDNVSRIFKQEVAVTDESGSYTYEDLKARSNCIASALEKMSVTKGTRVGLLGQQSASSIFSLLAILKTGGVYIPLDERNSDERLAAVVVESEASIIICDAVTKSRVPNLLSLSATSNVKVLDSTTVEVSNAHSSYLDKSAPADLAFIMFTSGSTGKPKGIMLSHANWVTHVRAATSRMNLGREVVLQQSALGYDTSLAQIFYALANGGRLVMSSNRGEMGAIARVMREQGVTLTLMSPSEYAMLIQYGQDDLSKCAAWKVAMGAGEAFPPSLRLRFRQLNLADLGVWNAYGPTEISGASNIGQVYYKDETLDRDTIVPIGSVLPGYNVCLVDETMQPVPVGFPGQLAVRGPSVSAGYLNQSSLSAEKFRALDNTISRKEAASENRWYLTGDLARMALDGSVLYLGRMEHDTMIKLRGLRIDLDEVSHAILETANGALSQAVVGLRGDAERQTQFLVAYVVFAQGRQPEDARGYLHGLLQRLPLPASMRPAQAIALETFPVKTSGKLDKDALQALPLGSNPPKIKEGHRIVNQLPSPTLTLTEKRLIKIWETVLDQDSTSAQNITNASNFFSAGGNSLLLLRLQAEIRKAFGCRIALPELFQVETLGSLALRIEQLTASSQKPVGNAVPVPSDDSIKPGIDWVAETAIPEAIQQLLQRHSTATSNQKKNGGDDPITIILTGSTGFLGGQIAQELQARPEVIAIHCVAVRDTLSPAATALQIACPKAILYSGDLSLPRLGLSRDDARQLFAEADAVIHNGADVSFLKPYEALRAANVGSTSEIVRMCLEYGRRGSSVHFVSTAGVGLLSGDRHFPATSMAQHSPIGKETVVDGYVSSKWASEVLLEKIAEAIPSDVMRVRIYRPSSITGQGAPALDIMHNIFDFSRRLKAVPAMEGSPWRGHFDFVSVQAVAAGLVDGVLQPPSAPAGNKTPSTAVDFVHLSGEEVLPVAEAKGYLERGSGYEYRELSLAEWAAEALQEGLHPLVGAFLESSMSSAGGIWFPRMQSDLSPQARLSRLDLGRERREAYQGVVGLQGRMKTGRGVRERGQGHGELSRLGEMFQLVWLILLLSFVFTIKM